METELTDIYAIRDKLCPNGIIIVNGFAAGSDRRVSEDDSVMIFEKTHMPTREEAELMLSSRDPPKIRSALRNATVGIAGLGGLGSNIAAMLTRSGIGRLIIADSDTVDATNLNRQNYSMKDIGKTKTEATEKILNDISPCTTVVGHVCRLDSDNIPTVFEDCSVVCEAFDSPEEKAMLINTILEKCPRITVISGSGMAGYGDSNAIITKKRLNRLYICGDGHSEVSETTGLTSPRVSICAGHMANAVIEILTDMNNEA